MSLTVKSKSEIISFTIVSLLIIGGGLGMLIPKSILTQPNRDLKGSRDDNADGNGDTNKILNFSKLSYQFTQNDISFIPDVVHTGDLMLNGNETLVIDNLNYFQQGNIFINNEAKLVINNSQFMLGRGVVPTIHTYIFVSEKASLEIENSTIFPHQPENDMGALVVIRNSGNVSITNSPTSIHLLEVYEGAHLIMINSEMVFEIGGLLQVAGGNIKVSNSTLGAIGLTVPANSHLNISGITSGIYLESWDIHDIIPDINYDLILEKTYILKDDLGPGPYERGWIFFLHPQTHATISNSELRKIFINFPKDTENLTLENLKVGISTSLDYGTIKLDNVIITGQWGLYFLDRDSSITIKNSNYLFIQIEGQSNLSMVDSHMVEFIPRDFFGIINFENCNWTNAGEIIGGQSYHSMENNFTINGSLKIFPELKEHLQWQNATVKRIYDVLVLDINSLPITGISLKIDGKTFLTNDNGKTDFPLIFNETSYIKSKELEVIKETKMIAKREIDFFTETPITIIHSEDTRQGDDMTPKIDRFIVLIIIIIIIMSFKKLRKKNKLLEN
ncbi:MAG: hypothetical protein ACXAB7_19740 [Candidatus Kariarchaeaceae archaeon]|jgi:hypothetical protein